MAIFGRKKAPRRLLDPGEEPAPTLPTPPDDNAEGLRPLNAHRDYILSLIEPLEPFGVQLQEATGLMLCEDIVPLSDLPTLDSAQITGYAVNSRDVARAEPGRTCTLNLVDREQSDPTVGSRQALYVAAGSVLPLGADCVVPLTYASESEDGTAIVVRNRVIAGENVRRAGSDVSVGKTILKSGQVLCDRHIGLLAGIGIDKVLVRPRPRVVVIAIGAGLIDPSRPISSADQFHDANSYMISAAAQAAGAHTWRVAVDSEDPDAVREAISDQLIRADLVITTGGITPGGDSVVTQVMPQLGKCDFADVAIQPGTHQGFGLIGDDEIPVIMLPGDPVGVYMSFHAIVVPALRKLTASAPYLPDARRCFASTVLRSTEGVTHLIRGFYTEKGGRKLVRPVGHEQDHLLSSLAEANCIICLDENTTTVMAGDPVTIWPLA